MEFGHLKFASLVVFMLILCNVESMNNQQEKDVDRIVETLFMETNKISAVGLTVVEGNGNTTLAKGYGFRDVENQIFATNSTKFAIASITKTFTATLVVKVLSEKFPELGASVLLELPIKKLHPNGNFTFSDRFRSEETSFRDLLSHRHALKTESLALSAEAFTNNDEYVYRTRYAKEIGPFRASGYYSNSMYALMGKLISEIAGQPFETLLENLFLELGMTDSTYFKRSVNYETFPNMTRGYYLKDGNITKSNSELWKRIATAIPAGGIISTASDMAKYITFHLNLGKVGNKQIISEEAMQWLRQPSFVLSMPVKKLESDITDGSYGLATGFSLGVLDGWSYLSHNGMWTPFTSELRIYPELKFGTFSVINGPSDIYENNFNHASLHTEIYKIVFGMKSTPAKKVLTNQNFMDQRIIKRNTGSVILKNLSKNKKEAKKVVLADPSALIGSFGNRIEGMMEIELSKDQPNNNSTLYMKFGQWATAYLIPLFENSTTFQVLWDTEFVEEFYFNIGVMDDQSIVDYFNEDLNSLQFIFGGVSYEFVRNATLDTLPQIPWSLNSCGPEYNKAEL